jgi:hypothetical protein
MMVDVGWAKHWVRVTFSMDDGGCGFGLVLRRGEMRLEDDMCAYI